jgi:hypothetical protein
MHATSLYDICYGRPHGHKLSLFDLPNMSGMSSADYVSFNLHAGPHSNDLSLFDLPDVPSGGNLHARFYCYISFDLHAGLYRYISFGLHRRLYRHVGFNLHSRPHRDDMLSASASIYRDRDLHAGLYRHDVPWTSSTGDDHGYKLHLLRRKYHAECL